jgi:hypothetical protein
MADTTSNPDELQDQDPSSHEEDTSQEQSTGTDQEQTATDTQDSQQSEDSTPEGEQGDDDQQEQTEDGKEDKFFDPSQLPDELKPVFKNMQAAYVKKTQALAEQRKQYEKPPEEEIRAPKSGDQSEQGTPDLRSRIVQKLGIDEANLQPQAKQVLDLMVRIAEEAAVDKVGQAVRPIYDRESKREVQTYFKDTPDAKNYSKKMAEIDRRTGEKLTLPELYYLASREDREVKTKDDLSNRAGTRRLDNAESSQGSSASGNAPSDNPIDQLFEESRNTDLLNG